MESQYFPLNFVVNLKLLQKTKFYKKNLNITWNLGCHLGTE